MQVSASLCSRRAPVVLCSMIVAVFSFTSAPAFAASAPTVSTWSTRSFHEGHVRVLGDVEPNGYDTHYYFEYGKTTSYGNTGSPTAAVDAGSGENEAVDVGQDLTGLEPGATYHYRIVATSTAPGNPVVDGPDRSFIAPTPAPAEPQTCPNEAVRTGASAHLPDCRAYEQVTPLDQKGAQDTFNYGSSEPNGLASEDGNRFAVTSATKWGSEVADPNVSTYVFSRGENGWQMASVTPQPEAGGTHYAAFLFNADLTEAALATYHIYYLGKYSPVESLVTGLVGGPYATDASLPFISQDASQVGDQWVAASARFNNLIFETVDHELLGKPTGTTSGDDLYEWSGGRLRQVNVDTSGATIGSCGAQMAIGKEGLEGGGGSPFARQNAAVSSPNAVSADGSKVFFEAVPSGECSEPMHTYMRVEGRETVDLGPDEFLGATADGSEALLLNNGPNDTHEFLLYDTATRMTSLVRLVTGVYEAYRAVVSGDMSALYFESINQLTAEAPAHLAGDAGFDPENLYRLEIAPGGQLQFIAQINNTKGEGENQYGSPNGDLFYYTAEGTNYIANPNSNYPSTKALMYDYREGTLVCLACASTFQPEPELNSFYMVENLGTLGDSVPTPMVGSVNGDYAFFDTVEALVPQDVNGEVEPSFSGEGTFNPYFGPSNDVYEWRRNGVDGCTLVQGCLALISSGTDGLKTMLLGTTPSGRDVFFVTHAGLLPEDEGTSGNVYDARIGGGFPEPVPPTECEGDACHAIASAPIDSTPASLTFSGPGNLAPVSTPSSTVVKRKTTKCAKGRRRVRGRCVKSKVKAKARRSRRSRTGKTARRSGR